MREQEIREQFQQETTQRAEQAHDTLKALYQRNNAAYQKDFQQVLEAALREYQNRQGADSDKKLKYIYVNCLRTSLEMETYEYIIRIMDESEYADRKMVEAYYVPKYLKKYIEADKAYFTRLIMSKVIRAKKYEVKDFLREYLWNTYLKPIPQEIYTVLSELDKSETFIHANTAEEVIVGYGEMLERVDEYWRFTVMKK